MDIVRDYNVRFDVGEGEVVIVRGVDWNQHCAGNGAKAAGFVIPDMRAGVAEN